MTTPPPAAFAFSWNFASICEKTLSEYLGTLERYFSHVPAGVMSSVVMLAPSLMRHLALKVSGRAPCLGSSLMFGPLETVTLEGSFAGAMTIESSIRNLAGILTLGNLPSFLGPVVTP